MKTKGRPQSTNIEDMRSYFGSQAVDEDYYDEDRIMDFLQDTLTNPNGVMPQPLQHRAPATLEEIILHEMTKGLHYPAESPGGGYGIIEELLQEL